MSGQTIALSLFLVLVAIGAIFFLSIFIVVKRTIARRKSRIGRIVYTPCGIGAPKVWKELINKQINDTVNVRTEPRVLGNVDSEGCEHISNRNLGFQFRAKTVDHFVDLKEKIKLSYPELEAPPVRNIRDFLMSVRSTSMNPKPSRKLIESYCCLYMTARHDPGPYTEADYFRFLDYHHQLLDLIIVKQQQCIDSPKSTFLDANTPENTFISQRASHFRSPHRVKKTDTISIEHLELQQLCKRLPASVPPREEMEGGNKFLVFNNPVSGAVGLVPTVNLTNSLGTRTAPTLSRRGSPASDDSQTALICLDPFLDTPPRKLAGIHD